MPAEGNAQFPTTHWTLISRLKSGDEVIARRALNDLCSLYHYPLYCFIRRRGLDHHDAQDALHDFLAKVLRLGGFENASESKGRLRGYLSQGLRHFLASNYASNARRSANEVSMESLKLPLEHAEVRYAHDALTSHDTPEQIFDRQWARELIQRVLQQVEDKYTARGRGTVFQALRPVLLRGGSLRGEQPAKIAAGLGMTEGTLRAALLQLLRKFRSTLEEEVAQTVTTQGDIKAEIDELMALFARK